jgi:hypothetical protein
MAVAAITIAVNAAMTSILVAFIPNPRVDNRSKRIVQKFRIYFDKKLKVDNLCRMHSEQLIFYCIRI